MQHEAGSLSAPP